MNTKNAVDVKKLADMLKIEESSAYGFLRTLAELGLVQIVKRPQPEGKKGKPANLYVFTDETGPKLGRLLLSKFIDHMKDGVSNLVQEIPTDTISESETLCDE